MSHQEIGNKSLRSYVLGFISCLLLTLLAFTILQKSYIGIALLALVQLFIQATCFLGLNARKNGRSHLLPFIFVIMVIVFLVGGSLWIMYNLNYNMISTISGPQLA